jgi:DNA-binding NarL/FixJ family response regulator
VIRLLAQGLNDYQVAHRLGISIVTVRRRVQRFSKRIGARTRIQAMAFAVRWGWVEGLPPWWVRDPTSTDADR